MTESLKKRLLNLDGIAAAARDLNKLGPDTEPEFLSIGRELNTLAGICYKMTDNAVQLSGRAKFKANTDESENESFIEGNRQVFAAIAGHVKTTITSLSEGEHLLIDLLAHMKRLREPIGKLRSTSKTFRVLGVGIKVESSRTAEGMQGFALLAEEVAEIAKLVQDNCQFCMEKATLVENGISTSRKVLNSTENSYDDSGELAVHNILQSLEDIGQKADELAAGIEVRSTMMVQGISEVVMAMQFHDITRQQLENVSSALLEVTEKASAVDTHDTSEANEQVVLEIYSILSIQAAHLNSIYEQVLNAKRQIEAGLGKTMEEARTQAKDASSLLEIEGRGGNKSIVGDLEREIDNVVLSLNKSLQVVKQAAEVSRGVYDNVVEIGSFVNTIEEIAFDVKILAINAMVEALKANVTGNALTVLAKELSILSEETRDGATDSIGMLQGIMEGTEKQLAYAANLDQSSVVVDEMIIKAREFTGAILGSLQEVSTIGHQMSTASQELSSKITKLVPGIKFPQVLGDRIDRNWQLICKTIDKIEDTYPRFQERSSEVRQMVEKLSHQYVMERERSIHAQVAGQSTSDSDSAGIDLFEDDGFELFEDDAPRKKQTAGGKENEDFGDNVELF